MNNKNILSFLMKKYHWPLLFIGGPILIWFLLQRNFFLLKSTFGNETLFIAWAVKFFTDNLKLGHIAFWDPFLYLGFPREVLLSYVGFLNPLWLITIALERLGLPFYQSFLYTITLYFLGGQIGFFLLAKALLQDRRAAYAAFLCFFFSSLTTNAFSQYHTVLFYVPSIWFFFFFFRLGQTRQPAFLLGMTLTICIMLTTYLPFYFLTILLFVGLLLILLNLRAIPAFLKNCLAFAQKNPRALILCFGVFLLTVWPGYVAFRSTADHDVVAPFRQNEPNSDSVYEKGVVVGKYANITDGAVTARMSLDELYSNYDLINYANDGFFYLPLFVYLVIFLGAVNRINKRIVVLATLTFFLVLLVMENTTPLHRFLFENIFYFRLLRNMFFFLPFLAVSACLLAGEQLRGLLAAMEKPHKKHRAFYLAWMGVVLGGCTFFLYQRPEVPVYSFTTIGLTAAFFVAYLFFPKYRAQGWVTLLLAASILFHPVKFFLRYAAILRGNVEMQTTLRTPTQGPKFSFTRSEERKNFPWYGLTYTDAPGSWAYGDTFVGYYPFYLKNNIPSETLDKYTKHKFYLYRQIALVQSTENSFALLRERFDQQTGPALISWDGALTPDLKTANMLLEKNPASPVQAIDKNSPAFEVEHFDVNSITMRTNFPEPYFLVYTDSYHARWRGQMNGSAMPLYRTNVAFKGFFLPAGPNRIQLTYEPIAGAFPYWGILIIFYIFSGLTVWLLVKEHSSCKWKS